MIQHLWYRLLGGEFANSVVAEIHKAANWREFDNYYRPIQYELIDPKENLTGLKGGFNTLLVAKTNAKNNISELLEPKAKEQPLAPQKELQRKFLWYDIELIDASSTVFNGVLTFVSLLKGAVVLRRRSGITEPLLVMQVKHPAGETGKHDYSYGILLEAHGGFGIADYSGWLLFYDCCGDYSGFAGSQYATAEQEIEKHLKRKTIEIHQLTIPKDKLLDLMGDKLLSTTKDVMHAAEKTRSTLRLTEDKLGAAKGLLLELLGVHHYYYTGDSKSTTKVEWSYERLEQEIDLLVKTGGSLIFVECKKPQIDNPVEQMERVKRKVDVLLGLSDFNDEWGVTPDTKKRYVFATWERPQPTVFRKLAAIGVDIIVLSVENAGIGRKARDRLKFVLNTKKSEPKTERDEFLKNFRFD
jgi:hypothetical protein